MVMTTQVRYLSQTGFTAIVESRYHVWLINKMAPHLAVKKQRIFRYPILERPQKRRINTKKNLGKQHKHPYTRITSHAHMQGRNLLRARVGRRSHMFFASSVTLLFFYM